MDLKSKTRELIKQVGYIRLVLLIVCGIFLIVVSLPEQKTEDEGRVQDSEKIFSSKDTDENDIYVERMEERLASILQMIEGAGKVEVMITLSSSYEAVINKDESYEDLIEKETGNQQKESLSSVKKEETVLTDEDGDQIPYVIKRLEPVIEGVIVVMEGGDNSYVSAAVTEAVQALFHVEAHKIRVLKMEDGS